MITNQVDQLILLMEAGGKGGISTQEASELLSTAVNTITGYYGQDAYRTLFKRVDESRYCLSSEGLNRFRNIVGFQELADMGGETDPNQ